MLWLTKYRTEQQILSDAVLPNVSLYFLLSLLPSFCLIHSP